MTDQTKPDPTLSEQAMKRYGLSSTNRQDVEDYLSAYNEQPSRRPSRTRADDAAKAVATQRKQAKEAVNLLGPDGKRKLSYRDMLEIGYQEAAPSMGKPPDNPNKKAIDNLIAAYE